MRILAYRLEGLSPAEHLAAENTLLETGSGEETILLFYVNRPCVVIGRNQNPWREAATGTGLPIFRRASGGGAVYHDEGNLNWSLIVPRSLHSQEGELAMMAGAISGQGVDIAPGPRGGLYCGKTSGYDGRKVSGTARRFGSRNVLHHGTLLVNADMERLRASLGGIETMSDTSLPSVPASPINVAAMNPRLSVESMLQGISLHLTGALAETPPATLIDLSRYEKDRAFYSSTEWIYGATPPFSLSLLVEQKEYSLRIEKGRMAAFFDEGSVLILGTSLPPQLSRYIGLPFSLRALKTLNDIAAAPARPIEEAV